MHNRAADRALMQLLEANFSGDEDDVEQAELQLECIELAQEQADRRYESALNKLAFEVGECERLS